MKNCFVCVLLIAFATSCKKDETVPAGIYKEYIIPRGEHYAVDNDFRSTRIHQLKFSALFDSSCIYTTIKDYNTTDVNKLYGFSDCNTSHQVNSARFGWRWSGNALDILAYCYVDSIRQIKFIGTVPIGQPADMSITAEPENYVFELNGSTVAMPRHCSTEFAEGYQLYPYFGGDEAAPHEIKIKIKEN